MKKHFKKRLAAFKVGLVLSIMITPFCFVQNVKADTSNVITYNSYGSTTRGTRGFEAFGNTYALIAYIDFNFNGQYNGIININLTGATPMSNFSVICENCHIIYQNTNYLQIEFYGQNNVSVNFVMKNATAGSFDIQSVTYQSMTKVSDSDSAELVNIKNRLTNLQNYTDGLEGLLTTNNSLLNDIKANTANSSSSSSTVNNIDLNVDIIADDLNLLKTSSDGILSALVDFLTDSVGGILTVENVIDAIETTTTALIGVQNQLTTINTTLTTISSTLSSINNAVQNIDNSIDTISWQSYDVNLTWSDTLTGTYQSSAVPSNTYRKIFIKVPLTSNVDPSIYRLKMYLFSGTYTDRRIVIDNVYYNNSPIDIGTYVNQGGNNEIYLYSPQIARELVLEVSNPSNYYLSFNPSTYHTVYLIKNTDIEYWQLLSFFEDYNYHIKELERLGSIDSRLSNINTTISNTGTAIVNAINALDFNPSGVTSEEVENVVNDFDLNFELVNDVEVDLSDLFDRNITGFNSMIDNNYDPIVTDLQDGTTFLNRFFVTFSKFDVIKPWFYLALIGLVLFALLG